MRFLRTYPKSICLVTGILGVVALCVLFPIVAAKVAVCLIGAILIWVLFLAANILTREGMWK